MTINKTNKYVAGFIAIVILVGVSGMSARDKNTAIGAAVGGVIGNQIGKDK